MNLFKKIWFGTYLRSLNLMDQPLASMMFSVRPRNLAQAFSTTSLERLAKTTLIQLKRSSLTLHWVRLVSISFMLRLTQYNP